MDLATGIVSQDGFGGTDRINYLGGTGQLQIQGTDFADRILGSDRDETFILRSGNDTLDGRGGNDLVRYDRNGIDTGIDANLQTGVVTGIWFGQAFRHQVTNVEQLRGSFFDDVLRAADTGSRLEGRSGNDTITGGAGIDELFGDDGDDVIRPGSNDDYDDIEAGTGQDEVIFDAPSGPGQGGFFIVEHWALEDRTGIAVEIDTLASTTGVIDKGAFGQTTLTDVQNAAGARGLMVLGTGQADQFNIVLNDGQWLEMQAGRGVDSYVIGGSGGVQINFDRDENWDWASQGAVVNLATGVIANDGFGFADAVALDAGTWISIRGTRNADVFTGSNTSDSTFRALGGNDTIRGGTQWDSVEYDDWRFATGVRVDLAAGTARGAFEGVAFAQQLSGVEAVVGTRDFADRLMGTRGANYIDGLGGNDVIFGDGFRAAFALSEARQVYRMYQATLDRAPDTSGQIDWTARLAEGTNTLVQVAAGFTGSREFLNVYGALNNTAFVTLLYQNVLDRAPDAGGLADWVGRLDGGASRAQVVIGFSEGAEFVRNTLAAANAFTQARNEAGWTDDVFRLYQATLDRAPDAAGFVDWIGRLGGGSTFLGAVSGFVESREFQRTYGALDDTAFVTLLYRNVLDRAPDAPGLANWLAQIAGGMTRAQVVEGFAQGREFVNATAQNLISFVRDLNFAGESAGIGGDEIRGGAGENRLWGGTLADEFVFDADAPAHHRVMDLEAWDFLTFQDFGYAAAQDIRAHMTQTGADVVFQDQGVTVTLANIQLAAITDDSLFFL